MQVDAGSSINADGQGYVALAGPGAGTGTVNGGSYGGAGVAQAANTTYGSASAPVDLGSGGGVYKSTAGAGGGAIRLSVTGTLTNNGVISANGAPVTGAGGGGAGGSVYVTTATLAGSGVFTANGGANTNQSGTGGGGGRVAIYYAGPTSFTGLSTSVAAGGTPSGSVGTVAFFDTSAANNSLAIYQNFPIPASSNITLQLHHGAEWGHPHRRRRIDHNGDRIDSGDWQLHNGAAVGEQRGAGERNLAGRRRHVERRLGAG